MLPKVLAHGKRLEGFRIQELTEGQFRIHYGFHGWKDVPSLTALKTEVMRWLDYRERMTQKTLADIAATRKSINRL
jgi:hypothetical protein